MESSQSSMLSTGTQKKSSLTPRELIYFHMENPQVPITDEDIENLNLVEYALPDSYIYKSLAAEESK